MVHRGDVAQQPLVQGAVGGEVSRYTMDTIAFMPHWAARNLSADLPRGAR